MANKPTIAWFGATGGCTFGALSLAVKDGYPCYALVRNEAKLREMLATRNISASEHPNLTILTGNLLDEAAIKKALAPKGTMVDIIISGVGGKPTFTTCPPGLKLDNPTICESVTRNIFSALSSMQNGHEKKPYFACVSTTGINQPHRRDVPIAFLPMYDILLPIPHKDKRAMEAMVVSELKKSSEKRAIDSYLIVRPSLLTDGAYTTMSKIRVGNDVKPAVGYTISRNDVGLWIYETIIKGGKMTPGGNVASITY